MRLFDLFKKKESVVIEGIGKFYKETSVYGISYECRSISSLISDSMDISFPEINSGISNYQKEYYRSFIENWGLLNVEISNMLKQKTDFKVVSILIPDFRDDRFDIDSEVVITHGGSMSSVIVLNNHVDGIIEIE